MIGVESLAANRKSEQEREAYAGKPRRLGRTFDIKKKLEINI